jgi:MFS family permease
VFRRHAREVIAGIMVCMATFVLFYLMTVFTLSWGTTALHYDRANFLVLQLIGVVFFGLTIPLSAWLAERGRKPVMFGITAMIAVFGLFLARLFTAGPGGALTMMVLGLALMGMTYGPLGTVVSELFPTSVRYTGSSLAFSMAGILGASLAPYIATWLANKCGLEFVGYYLTASAIVSFVGLLMIRETSGDDLTTGVVS